MKHLQLNPPLLIITMGYPGSGKSFFARQFAELYRLARISEDRIRYELFERPEFNDDEADIINRVMFYMIEQTMQTEHTIICEGNFMEAELRKQACELANRHGYRTLIVWLQTDLETAMQRAGNRDRRNLDSKYAFSIDRQTFAKLKDQLSRPGEKEQAVVISGKHAFKSQCLTVLKKIAATYSDSLSRGEFSAPATRSRPAPSRPKPTNQLIQ